MDLVEGDAEDGFGDGVEGGGGAAEVDGAVEVLERLAGGEGGGRGGGLEFVEGAHFAVVRIGIDRVAGEGVLLDLPLGVHIRGGAGGEGELDDGQDAGGGVVGAEDGLGAGGVDADLGTVTAVATEEEGGGGLLQAGGGDLAEIVVGDAAVPGLERDDNRRGGGGVEHAEDPDGEEAGFLRPGLGAGVGDAVGGFEGDGGERRLGRDTELGPEFGGVEEADFTIDGDVELRAGVVGELETFLETDAVGLAGDDGVGVGIEGGGGLPVGEVEGGLGREEDGELTAFGAEPEAVLAAEGVHVGDEFFAGDEGAVDPAVGGGAVGGGHDAALVGGGDGELGFAFGEEDGFGVLAEEGEVGGEVGGGEGEGEEGSEEGGAHGDHSIG